MSHAFCSNPTQTATYLDEANSSPLVQRHRKPTGLICWKRLQSHCFISLTSLNIQTHDNLVTFKLGMCCHLTDSCSNLNFCTFSGKTHWKHFPKRLQTKLLDKGETDVISSLKHQRTINFSCLLSAPRLTRSFTEKRYRSVVWMLCVIQRSSPVLWSENSKALFRPAVQFGFLGISISEKSQKECTVSHSIPMYFHRVY